MSQLGEIEVIRSCNLQIYNQPAKNLKTATIIGPKSSNFRSQTRLMCNTSTMDVVYFSQVWERNLQDFGSIVVAVFLVWNSTVVALHWIVQQVHQLASHMI